MADYCDDNRFELIEKYKQKLIDETNIETAPDEMAVINDILFRFWQMGWLDKLEQPEQRWIPCSERLPDENQKVIVCLTDWQTGEQEIDVSCRRDYNMWRGHGRYNESCVAWMPLPEPWEGENDG